MRSLLERFSTTRRDPCAWIFLSGAAILAWGTNHDQTGAENLGLALILSALLIALVLALTIHTEDGPILRSRDYVVSYVNWRGEERIRRIRPLRLYFGANEWHPEPQWILEAEDTETGFKRSFALGGIQNPHRHQFFFDDEI